VSAKVVGCRPVVKCRLQTSKRLGLVLRFMLRDRVTVRVSIRVKIKVRVSTGLSTAILLFSGHKNYKISGHFQDTKTMLQANILSSCVMHMIKKASNYK